MPQPDNILSIWNRGRRRKSGDAAPPGSSEPPPVAPEWADAPFRCLGKSGKAWWFFDSKGEIVEYAHAALGQWPTLLALCGGNDDWLVRHFPAHDRDGVPTGGFSARRACGAVMRHAASLALFDPTQPRRRYGLWPVGGGYALHLGGTLIWRGETVPAGICAAGALWPALGDRPAPASPASAQDGATLERHLASWRWVEPEDRRGSAAGVFLGLVVAGMFGAALPWRPHGAIAGELGTGKTTLLRDVAGALSPLTRYLNDYTEAGIRQLLNESAATVILDEAEGAAGAGLKIAKVIELLRRASSGSGAQTVRGGADHVPHTFSVACSALLGSIYPPPLAPQDASRITLLELLPLQPGTDVGPVLEFIETNRLALWGRAVGAVDRAIRAFHLLRGRLVRRGFTSRMADQLGSIAASRWVMVSDDDAVLADDETADEALTPVEFLIASEEERMADSGPVRCLQRLLTSNLDMAGDKITVGQALSRLRALAGVGKPENAESDEQWQRIIKDANQARDLLEGHGLKWHRCPLKAEDGAPAPPIGLYVTTGAHPQLLRIFRDTDWQSQAWATALKRLPGARGGRDVAAVAIGKVKQRAVWVPNDTLAAHM